MFVNDRVFHKEIEVTKQATLQLHRSLLEKEVMRLETRLQLQIELRRLLEAALGYGDKVLLESSQMKEEIPVETSDLLADVVWLESAVSSLETQAHELRGRVDFARSETQKYINESQDTRYLTLEGSLKATRTTKIHSSSSSFDRSPPTPGSHNTASATASPTTSPPPQSYDPAFAVKFSSSEESPPTPGSHKTGSATASPTPSPPARSHDQASAIVSPTLKCSSSTAADAPGNKSRRPLLPRKGPIQDQSTGSTKRQQDKSRTSWSSSTKSSSSSSSSKPNLFSGKLYASVDVPNVAYLLKNQTKHTANRIIKSLALPSYKRREQSKSLDAGTV